MYTSVKGRIPVIYGCGCFRFEASPGPADLAGQLTLLYDGENPVDFKTNCYTCNCLFAIARRVANAGN